MLNIFYNNSSRSAWFSALLIMIFSLLPIPTIQAGPSTGNISKYRQKESQDHEQDKNGQEFQQNQTLTINNGWARASIGSNSNSAAYMEIRNNSNQQITIIGANALEVSDNVELHKSFVDEQGISRMTDIDKIIVPANSTILLKPGQIHIMLFDLRQKLQAGDRFFLTLLLQDRAPVQTEIIVK